MTDSHNKIKYNTYELNLREFCFFIALNTALIVLIGWLFYRSFVGIILLSPSMILFLSFEKKYLMRKRLSKLIVQFKDMLGSINTALTTGYSLENALKEAYLEMKNMYGVDSYICIELHLILRQITLGVSIEDAFSDFAERSHENNILTFAEVLHIAKRSGHLISTIHSASSTLIMKLETEKEISAAINSKLYERNVMAIMPLLIIIYVSLTSSNLLLPLYSSFAGRLIMTFCLGLYGFALWLSSKIFDIHA